ncbi:MAG: Rne/Rng family ribonuclease [Pseudomonadota bacterium]
MIMSEEILINVTPEETRVALLENGVLQEVLIERATHLGIVGSLYKGRVLRVLPGMQAAFVDIGLERSAFLHVADMREARLANAEAPESEPDGEAPPAAGRLEKIEHLLREGDEILVQVIKDALGSKGARLSTQISIPSRFLVFLPGLDHVGVSVRIEDDAERRRLRELVCALRAEGRPGGYIVRTAGEGASADALAQDMEMLHRIWRAIGQRMTDAKAGGRIHDDLPLALRTLRDLGGSQVERVRIDSPEVHEQAMRFAETFFPGHAVEIQLYHGERPIFDLFGVEDEIQRALERKVPLKSGGYLVIDQTESMTTIDVNTGGYVGYRNLEDTIFRTNLDATQAIARQLRLRNLGGIIIIDFIDMEDPAHRIQVVRALEKSLERDPARTKISAVSPLGLVEMTRKRIRESLGHILCDPCPVCNGRGYVKSIETVCFEILREVQRAARQFDTRDLLVLASDAVIDRLLEDKTVHLAELEQHLGRPVRLQRQSVYQNEQFDVVLL